MASRPTKVFYQFKLILLGDSGVGKSSLLSRYMDEEFVPNQPCTVNADYKIKAMLIDEFSSVQMTIWDTCGQERYRAITRGYFKDAHGIILVYDVADKRSFSDLDIWLEEIKKNTVKEDISIILVGNKIDLKDSKAVSTEQALAKAKEWDIPLMETSAKDATNVKEAFHYLLREMYCEMNKTLQIVENKNLENNNGVQLDVNEQKKKKGCC